MKINSNSLVVKIIFFGVALVFLTLLIFSAVFLVSQRSELYRQTLDKGQIFAEFSAQSIYNDYISFYTQSSDDNLLLFKNQLEKKLARNRDITNVELVSINGRILFDSGEMKEGKYNQNEVRTITDPESLNLLKNEGSSFRAIEISGQPAAEIFVPIKEVSSSHVLSMRYLLSFNSFTNQMLAIYRQVALSFLIVFIFVFLLSIPVYLNIIRPIIKLSTLTKKIAQGNLNTKMEIGRGKDEIGVLAENFNIMVDELRSAKEKSLDHNKKLEKDLEEKAGLIEQEKKKLTQEQERHQTEVAELKKKNEELEKLNKLVVDW